MVCGGDVCVVCFASTKSSERECFVPTGTHLGVKLLKYCMIIYFSHTRSLSANACSPICPSELIHLPAMLIHRNANYGIMTS